MHYFPPLTEAQQKMSDARIEQTKRAANRKRARYSLCIDRVLKSAGVGLNGPNTAFISHYDLGVLRGLKKKIESGESL